jgi:hypothetical protein
MRCIVATYRQVSGIVFDGTDVAFPVEMREQKNSQE